MKTIGIFYGSSTGTTEGIANRIADKLRIDSKDVHDVSNASPADVSPYEALLLGSSTWGGRRPARRLGQFGRLHKQYVRWSSFRRDK